MEVNPEEILISLLGRTLPVSVPMVVSVVVSLLPVRVAMVPTPASMSAARFTTVGVCVRESEHTKKVDDEASDTDRQQLVYINIRRGEDAVNSFLKDGECHVDEEYSIHEPREHLQDKKNAKIDIDLRLTR